MAMGGHQRLLRGTITAEVMALLLMTTGLLLWPRTTHWGTKKVILSVMCGVGWKILVGIVIECLIWLCCSARARNAWRVWICLYAAAVAALVGLSIAPVM